MLTFNPLSTVKRSHTKKSDLMNHQMASLHSKPWDSDHWAPLTAQITEALGHLWAWLLKKISNMDEIYLIHNTFNQTRFAEWVPPTPDSRRSVYTLWRYWGWNKSKHTIHIGFHTHTCTYRLKVTLCSIFVAPAIWLQVVTWGLMWNFPLIIAWQFSKYFRLQHFQFCIWNLKILIQRIWSVCRFTL